MAYGLKKSNMTTKYKIERTALPRLSPSSSHSPDSVFLLASPPHVQAAHTECFSLQICCGRPGHLFCTRTLVSSPFSQHGSVCFYLSQWLTVFPAEPNYLFYILEQHFLLVCLLCFLVSDCRCAWFLLVAVTVACPAEPTRSVHTVEHNKPSANAFLSEDIHSPCGQGVGRGGGGEAALQAAAGRAGEGGFFSLSTWKITLLSEALFGDPAFSCRRSSTKLYLKS